MSHEEFRELLQLGPSAYVAVILAGLLMTVVEFGALPFCLARLRKKTVTKGRFWFLCYAANFPVMILDFALSGKMATGPYVLWTTVFVLLGIKKLQSRGVLEGFRPGDAAPPEDPRGAEVFPEEAEEEPAEDFMEEANGDPAPSDVLFCRKCGKRLIAGSRFCSFCGAAVIKGEGWSGMP